MGVISELKHGLNFVTTCLRFPSDPSSITHESVFSLLECIQLLLERSKSLEDDYTKELSKAKELSKHWLRTHAGYRPPDKCLLFDSKWSLFLKPTDGPFIDETFYGPKFALYGKELNAIGVIGDVKKGCSFIASHLDLHSESSTIVRIYRCLNEYDWEPENEATKRIWIPK
ncbi:ATP/DNA-binding protein [Spatholobus suberectus]|nr:ATP/DNA-binding protein [Spatholobus suberectus]